MAEFNRYERWLVLNAPFRVEPAVVPREDRNRFLVVGQVCGVADSWYTDDVAQANARGWNLQAEQVKERMAVAMMLGEPA